MNMHAFTKVGGRTARLASRRAAAVVLLAAILSVGEGRAQQRVGQDGRLLDANPQVGGSRYNYGRPVSPLVGGNPYATGNISRGFSLRSFSPIQSPTAFRAPLGSGLLSNFMRDSVSVADQAGPSGGLISRPFFDPARTAPTGAYLRGYYDSPPAYPVQGLRRQQTGVRAGTSPLGSGLPYGSPPARRLDLELSTQAPVEYLGVPLNTELSSAIFGVSRPALPGPLSTGTLPPPSTYLPEAPAQGFGAEGAPASAAGIEGPLDFRVWPEPRVQVSPTPLDVLMQERATRLLTEPALPTLLQPGEASTAPDAGRYREDAVAAAGVSGGPGLLDASMLPGYDVFTDMRLALELSLNPQAEWYAEMLGADRAKPTAGPAESPVQAVDMQARAVEAAEDFLTRVLNTPLRTFVGGGASAANDELRRAEAAMELGRYYDAVRHYERVRRLDPANPLPLIGKGHALLAAGEYVSAALSLIRGLERFPELTRFEVDLTALVGGGEIVDIRRADLMKQLARHEDPQLRFLLGYLEIHSGIFELGLRNLDRAAREAKPGTLISRYADLIRRSRMLPPRLLPPGGNLDSTTNEPRSPGSEPSAPREEPE